MRLHPKKPFPPEGEGRKLTTRERRKAGVHGGIWIKRENSRLMLYKMYDPVTTKYIPDEGYLKRAMERLTEFWGANENS